MIRFKTRSHRLSVIASMSKKSILILMFLGGAIVSSYSRSTVIRTAVPKSMNDRKDVIELRCAPIDTVRVAVVGLGNRGIGAVNRLSHIPTVKIVALCDIVPEYVKRAQDMLVSRGFPTAAEFTGEEDWKEVCQMKGVDLVYNCTHWDLHAPMAVEAMRNGKHVALEVPAALTLKECWALVDASERYRRHCIMLENCCYDFFEMATLNMVQQGLFGELVHAEGAYIHDLRRLNFDPKYYVRQWRLRENKEKEGNLYPTHGLGPIAHAMNIHRGDRMNYLVCVSSDQFGMTEYAKARFGENSTQAKENYRHGDINTMIIKTVKGKTMMIQHDVTSPRPYSRLHLLSGTKGFAQKYPNQTLAFEPNAHNSLPAAKRDSMIAKYQHPIVRSIEKKAKEVGGHGGMDFIMDYRLIYCLNRGLPMDQDVYDAAEWSSMVELSRISIENNGAPVEVPDFTRGAWTKVKKVTYYLD